MNKRSKIAILGFGEEGKAVLKYLIRHQFNNVTVCDQKVDLPDNLPRGVSANLGKDYLEGLDKFDVVFRSPGIKYLDPHVQLAVATEKKVTSSTAFFLEQAHGETIGITGTKGKGTTSTLIYLMLKKGGKKVHLGGNIGNPAISFLDKIKLRDIVVLELSSFQLQDVRKSPKMAVILNTTTDHLDYHVDRTEYMQAKEQLIVHQGKSSVTILNKDYEYSKYYAPLVKGKLRYVSVRGKVEDGAYVKDEQIFYAKKGKSTEIAKVSEVALTGAHNLENILPAVVIAKEYGISDTAIKAVIRSFKGLPHRLEFVREVRGVKYFNDSFSTTPETSMAAVDSFDIPTVLIAGGSDKGLDYHEWAVKILTKPSLVTVILIGETADKMEKALVEAEAELGEAIGSPTKILRRNSLEDAILDAYAECAPGSVTVMSPAAASFDMFKNYKERGEMFREAVLKLS